MFDWYDEEIAARFRGTGKPASRPGATANNKRSEMNDTELEAAIAAQPYEKVTKEGIEAKIKAVDYHVLPNSTVTICNITMTNGFSVRGESACVDSRNFNLEIGRNIAYRNAFNALWQLEGYLLAEFRATRGRLAA